MKQIRFFGIRHHGVGSARSLLAALSDYQPDVLLIEAPTETEDLLHFLADPEMQPPVALLAYATDNPSLASYFPFARFSPEYQAIRFALAQGIPIRPMDLPQAVMLPLKNELELSTLQSDPLSEIAQVAGYDDAERWWDSLVEQRYSRIDIFEGIADLMAALRAEFPDNNPITLLREAHMRFVIQRASEFNRVAVVCGAWHVPALKDLSSVEPNPVENLQTIPISTTWTPWTFNHLARASGYGAGIVAPNWYQFLWDHSEPQALAIAWLTQVSQTLRQHDLPASPAQVIDAVQLAETLATLRGRSLPDLHDLNEATLSVLCHGNSAPLDLIHREMIVGYSLGSVPANVPTLPLQADFYHHIQLFELEISDEEQELILDLRLENERQLSQFFYRLRILEFPWAKFEGADVIQEAWTLAWEPALTIQLVEKNVWGNTIPEAAVAYAIQRAQNNTTLLDLTQLVQWVLFADLKDAIQPVVQRLGDETASTDDIEQLMSALPPLVDILNYGDTRRTQADLITPVVDTVVVRIIIGLPAVCVSLDDDRALQMVEAINACDYALRLLHNIDFLTDWRRILAGLSNQQGVHSLVKGRACRIVIDSDFIPKTEAVRRMRLALSPLVPPIDSAAWLRGFLQDSGSILIYDESLLNIIDQWLSSLTVDEFENILPLVFDQTKIVE